MKNISFLFMILLPTGIFAQAQNNTGSKYGNDSATCVSNLSTMIEFTKIKVFDYALPAWRSVFTDCPRASKNIYINGATIFKNLIEKQEDMQLKDKYIDTLMMIYDQRIRYFGEEGFVNIRKGMDLLNYRPSDKANIYKFLDKGIQLSGVKSEYNAFIAYLQVSILLSTDGTLSKDKVLDNYNLVSKLLDQGNSGDAAVSQTREIVDKLFAGSGTSDCNKTNEIYSVKLTASNLSSDQLKQIIKTLEISKCTESEAYSKANEMFFSIEPSSTGAYNLAKIYFRKQNYVKAEEFYNQAIKLETNPEILANYYYEIAVIQSSGLNHFAKARENALKAAGLKKDWGQPYMLIGNIYASSNGSCAGTEVEKLSVFWAAVDKFSVAKSVDPKLTEEANNLIAKYSTYFPNNETLFFYGLKSGDSYSVKCWINENTRVRAR